MKKEQKFELELLLDKTYEQVERIKDFLRKPDLKISGKKHTHSWNILEKFQVDLSDNLNLF